MYPKEYLIDLIPLKVKIALDASRKPSLRKDKP
jgi:hypothetical protein